MNAATQWFRFSAPVQLPTPLPQPISTSRFAYWDGTERPRIGEWCLWSIVTDKGREYYTGVLIDDHTVSLDSFPLRTATVNSETFWARVCKLTSHVLMNRRHSEMKAISTLTNKYLEDALTEIIAAVAEKKAQKIGPTLRVIRECAGCFHLRTDQAYGERRYVCTHEKSVDMFGDCNNADERAAYTGATVATGPVTPEWCPVELLKLNCLECGRPLTKNDPSETDKCKSCYEDYER